MAYSHSIILILSRKEKPSFLFGFGEVWSLNFNFKWSEKVYNRLKVRRQDKTVGMRKGKAQLSNCN